MPGVEKRQAPPSNVAGTRRLMNMAVKMILPIVVICGSIASILFSIEVGYHTGVRRCARNPNGAHGISPTVEAAIFGLMGLLITFIFVGAATRFDNRRNLVVNEANAVATAYSPA